MRAILLKEFKTSLLSPRTFIFLAIFTTLSGLIFFSLIEQFNPLVQRAALVPNSTVSLNEQVLTPHLSALRVLLLFVVPLLTMRSFAGEREQKTLPLLLVSPVSTLAIVLGKFIILGAVLCIFLGMQLYFPLALSSVATLEVIPVYVGLFGIYLLGLLYVAVGICVSSFSQSQIVSGAITFLILFLLHSVEALIPEFGGGLLQLVRLFSPNVHLEGLVQGLVKSSDLAFFLFFTGSFLVVAHERINFERGR